MKDRTCCVLTPTGPCGNPVAVISRGWCATHYKRWQVHGDVQADIPIGPYRGDPLDRFWPKVNQNGPVPAYRPDLGPCWLWTGARHRPPAKNSTTLGYGSFSIGGTPIVAHVFAYQRLVGPIPAGYEVDHLCRNSLCVRPDHLEAVTPEVNMERTRRPVCKHGHAMVGDNVYITPGTTKRNCRQCNIERAQQWREAAKAKVSA